MPRYFELSQASSLSGYRDFETEGHDHYLNPPTQAPHAVTQIMPDYTAYSSGWKSGECWVSKLFYSDTQHRYKLCLNVQASENLSVFICLMHGEYYDQLDWPFNANITIKLKNHGRRGRNWGRKIMFRNGHRVTRGTVARGDTNFITLYKNSSFVKDDTLWFEVVSVELV